MDEDFETMIEKDLDNWIWSHFSFIFNWFEETSIKGILHILNIILR
jgi:hypothetical protein